MSEATIEAPAVEAARFESGFQILQAVEAPVSQPAGVDDPSEAAADGPEAPAEASEPTDAQPEPSATSEAPPETPALDVAALADSVTSTMAAVKETFDAWPPMGYMPNPRPQGPEERAYRELARKVDAELYRIEHPTFWYHRKQHTEALSTDPLQVAVRQAHEAARLDREATELEGLVADPATPVGIHRDAEKRVRKARSDASIARWELTRSGGDKVLAEALAALAQPPAVPTPEPPQPADPAPTKNRW